MKKAVFAAVVLLTITPLPVQAAITVYYSQADMNVFATALGSPYQSDADSQNLNAPYANTMNVSNGGSYQVYDYNCECYRTVSYYSGASAGLYADADVVSGVFYVSGDYSSGVGGEDPYAANAGGGVYVQVLFDIDRPYAYRLDVTARDIGSGGSPYFNFQFNGDFQDPSDAVNVSGVVSSYSLFQEGVLLPNNYSLARNSFYASVGGCQFSCSGGNSGALDLRLTLTPLASTPVPLPAAAWLLLSGLAGLGFVRRRKAH